MGDPDSAVEPVSIHEEATRVFGRPRAIETSAHESREHERGSVLGRYIIVETIGRGGMGRVLRAYDSKLRREVALKLVGLEELDREAELRLIREAQAMAQLNHPNVVGVYDVETTGAGVVIAMELVQGPTLRGWLRTRRHSWTEVVDVFVQAGQGLAAAHDRDLAHRDFKPANVLLTADGRVKVTDFGLVKALGAHEARSVDPSLSCISEDIDIDIDVDSDPGASQSLTKLRKAFFDGSATTGSAATGLSATQAPLTEAGMMLGTPKFMAPEQFAGEGDVRSDQFAFCLALWEALAGTGPYGNKAARSAKRTGPPPWPSGLPGVHKVPRYVIRILERGLAPRPEERWPSMLSLLTALGAKRRTTQRKWALAAGGSGLVGVGLLLAFARDAGPELCVGAASELAGIWDGARKQEVRSTILGVQARFADSTWERVEGHLDDYAAQWVEQHQETCEATSVRGVQSAAVMDLRMVCLGHKKDELAAAVDVLAAADTDVVSRSIQVVTHLPPLARCKNVEALLAETPPPRDPAVAQGVEQARARLATVNRQLDAGQYAQAEASALELHTQAAVLGYAPLQAEIALVLGNAQEEGGKYVEAERTLSQGLSVALTTRVLETASMLASRLGAVTGDRQAHHDEGIRLAQLGLDLARGQRQSGTFEAHARENLAYVLTAQGKYPEAAVQLSHAFELRFELNGLLHPATLNTRASIAELLGLQGKYAASAAQHREVIADLEHALGPEHPDVASTRGSLASALRSEGKYDEAIDEQRRALNLLEQALGDQHPRVARCRSNLAGALWAADRYDDARIEIEAALGIWTETLGPNDIHVARARSNLANVLRALGDDANARKEQRHALAMLENILGPRHPTVATSRFNLAVALRDLGKPAQTQEAYTLLHEVLSVRQEVLGSDNPQIAYVLHELGDLHLQRGDISQAIALFERAWGIRARAAVPAFDQADTAWALARALYRDDPNNDRADELAKQAQRRFAEDGSASATERLLELDAWLALR